MDERETDVPPFNFAASFMETVRAFDRLPMGKQVDYYRSMGGDEGRRGLARLRLARPTEGG